MPEPVTRLVLLTPHGVDDASIGAVREALAAACAAGDVAAVVLRLAPADERGLVNRVKQVAPAAQEHGAAVLVALPDPMIDAVAIAARGGADGVHVEGADAGALRALRGRLRDGRILGCGGLGSKHAAMAAGEAEVDYLTFGGLDASGAAPDPERVRERAGWWAEIFETPCIAVASEAGEVAALAATGAEFVGLESALWLGTPEAVAQARIAMAGGTR